MSASTFPFRNLARALLAGEWTADGLLQRGTEAVGKRERWLRPLIRRVLAHFPQPPSTEDEQVLVDYLQRKSNLRQFRESFRTEQHPRRVFWIESRMNEAGCPADSLPALPTVGALAEWLHLSPGELDWFARPPWQARRAAKKSAGHYVYRWVPKFSGGVRLLEVPKSRLKAIQRRILGEILDRVPPHDAAHGYAKGRSILSYASVHADQDVILRMDLRDFFASVTASRVHALFRKLGYPSEVARLLTRLCTNVTPATILDELPHGRHRRFSEAHLPQGAPTSPCLANLCAFHLDCRLSGLTGKLGGAYTRYADDLAISGCAALPLSYRRLQVLVCRIALEEGFEVQTRKTRVLRRGVRQQLAGVVVNIHPNVKREEYDRLKAILHNCVLHGPASQNHEGVPDFRAHLLGRIAHVTHLNAKRGRKLLQFFGQIDWSTVPARNNDPSSPSGSDTA